VLGSASVLSTLEKHLKLKSGETSRDGLFSIEIVACIGACGLAPVICVNGKFHARVTEKSIIEIIDNYRKENDENKN
jgi:NADH-quinone oxidoreductase subunit E